MQFRELVRHFFNGFFDVELIHPEAESKLGLGHILAVLMVPGLGMGMGLLFRPSNAPPLWQNQAFYLFYGMSMIGFVTVFQWDTLFLGRRDWVVLGALPVRTRTIIGAKVVALLRYLALFLAVVSGPTTLLLPFGFADSHEPMLMGIAVWIGHAAAVVAASLFTYLCLIAAQGTLMNLLPAWLFRRVTPLVQVVALYGTLIALFTYPTSIRLIAPSLPAESQNPWLWRTPQFWFLGVAQVIAGKQEPVWAELSRLAIVGFAVALIWASGVYLLSYYRHAKRSLEQASEVTGTPSYLDKAAAWPINRVWLENATERATFWFTVKTSLRSRRHWLILGGYAGVGLALVFDGLLAGVFRSGGYELFLKPNLNLFHIPLLLTFLLLAGLRFIFSIPAELQANWVFRITESPDRASYDRGVRKAMFLLMVLPVLGPVLVVEGLLWDWPLAMVHAGINGLLSWILVQAAMLRFDKIPFTCSYLPGRANLPYSAGLYFGIFAMYTTAMAKIGFQALMAPTYAPALKLLAGLLALAGVLEWRRRRRPDSSGPLVFNDEPDQLTRLQLTN